MASRRRRRLIGGSALGAATLLGLAAFVPSQQARAAVPAAPPGAVTLSKTPIPADASWQSYVESNGASTVKPAAITATSGAVTNAQALVSGSGTATLTDVAGQAPPTIVLDYGKEVGGLPFFNVSSATPASSATSVTLRSGYSEARQYLLGAAPTTTLAAPAAAGAANASVNSVAGFYAGEPLTIGSGASAQSAQITAVGTPAAALNLYSAAAPGDTSIKVTSVANLAVGAPVSIGSGASREQATITSVGTAGRQLRAHGRHGDDARPAGAELRRRVVPVECPRFHEFRAGGHDPRPQGLHAHRGAAVQPDRRRGASQCR